MRTTRGFTLIELMIVIVIIGILAAVAIPAFIQIVGRAREGATKSNMHTLQIAAEDYAVTFDGNYATVIDASHIADRLPSNFRNPFDGSTGPGGGMGGPGEQGRLVDPAPGHLELRGFHGQHLQHQGLRQGRADPLGGERGPVGPRGARRGRAGPTARPVALRA